MKSPYDHDYNRTEATHFPIARKYQPGDTLRAVEIYYCVGARLLRHHIVRIISPPNANEVFYLVTPVEGGEHGVYLECELFPLEVGDVAREMARA